MPISTFRMYNFAAFLKHPMALLLCIDTALETATVGLCSEDGLLDFCVHENRMNHASFLQSAIQNLVQKQGILFSDIDAVAVVNGPGSYTGLRVGLASAKGICYAAQKPLLLINTLQVMATAAIEQVQNKTALYCPMIDARRNEVFAAVYDSSLREILSPQPIIIERHSFSSLLTHQKVYFFGSGHNKCSTIIGYEQNAMFIGSSYSLSHTNILAQELYAKQQFANIGYAEPYYVKDFFSTAK